MVGINSTMAENMLKMAQDANSLQNIGLTFTGLTHGYYMSVRANGIRPYIWCFQS